jgi:hypothetical protein
MNRWIPRLHVIMSARLVSRLPHGHQVLLQRRPSPSPMPPWVASVPRPTILFRKSAIDRLSCAYHPRIALNGRSSKLGFRFAYAHVSPTAINARPNIPEKNKQLYNALSELSGKAESYVNISRLQLALRGLASADAVTRVAGMLNTYAQSYGRRRQG